MTRSTDRILTTHAGSLPRPVDLVAMGEAMQDGKPVDAAAYEARLTQAVDIVVREQVECGIDIVDDGEFGKPAFVADVGERLSGFEVDPERSRRNPWAGSREARSFPDYYAETTEAGSYPVRMVCTGPIAYRGHEQLQRDIANFRAALGAVTVEEAFMPAVSPATVGPGIATLITTASSRICSPLRTPCARNTGRSSTPASSCRSTIRVS
jgi:5-methyltetrahydropteroyltriglutamate--homocysteine methyltransferase